MLGPRVPVSWFRNLDNASIDLLLVDGFEPWISSDLVQNSIQMEVDPRRFCQIAVVAVIIGDLNAVYSVEVSSPTLVRRVLANSINVGSRMCFSPFCYDRRRLCRRSCHVGVGSLFLVAPER